MNTRTRYNWKLFLILWLASVGGVLAILPYSLTLQGPALAKTPLPLPLNLVIAIQVGQNAILFAIAVAAGLFFAYRTKLGAPILEGWLAREPVRARIKAILLPAVLLGIAASVIIIGLDVAVFAPALQAELGNAAKALGEGSNLKPPAWQGFLASFYGGIDEEVLLRLFVLSLLAWLGKFVSHTAEGAPTLAVLWSANILAAVLFGLGHLPATSLLIPLTPLVVARAIVLNGLGGIAFGYLYLTRGLEAAMLSHFTADIVLHVIFAL